jgi:hypothetical protein
MKIQTLSYFVVASVMVISSFGCQNNTPEYSNTTQANRTNYLDTAQQAQTSTSLVIPVSSKLDTLKNTNGKYPNEINLFKNPELTQRLQKLLGTRYDFLIKVWAVESQIIANDSVFIASACEAHNCGATNFTIIIDFWKNVVYVGIRENEVAKSYSDDGSSCDKLDEFMQMK